MALVCKNFSDIITFTRASSATYFDSGGVLQTATTDTPRFDYDPSTLAARGLLIEEARTNSIRNNTMQGAVAGTPGTNPTNWAVTLTADGITQEVSAVGTENGIAYIDIRYYGTPTAGTNRSISFETVNQIAAISGQTWTESVYVKLQAGSFSNTSTTLNVLGTNGTTGTESFSSSAITSTPSNLRQCRLSVTGTFANAGTTHAQPRIRIGYTVGVAIDITLRIGLPQLELGAFATSVITTTTAAATRSADVASVNTLSPWYNASNSTLFVDYVWEGLKSVAGQRIVVIDNGATTNYFGMTATSGNTMQNPVVIASTTEATNSTPTTTYAANTSYKQAVALELNNSVGAINGVAGTPDTVVNVPTGLTTMRFGASSAGVTSNIWFRRITYYPRRLSNAELQTITA